MRIIALGDNSFRYEGETWAEKQAITKRDWALCKAELLSKAMAKKINCTIERKVYYIVDWETASLEYTAGIISAFSSKNELITFTGESATRIYEQASAEIAKRRLEVLRKVTAAEEAWKILGKSGVSDSKKEQAFRVCSTF